jgi:hypothetical protein
MKIAIPTNDGLTLNPQFGQAKGFLILTLELGEITAEEMKWNTSGGICATDDFLGPITDCGAVLVNNISPAFSNLIFGQNKDIIHTKESIITNACIHYIQNDLSRETNTCCCP